MHDTVGGYAYGQWLLVAVNVGIVRAFTLSYSTPKRKVEWRSLGVLAAWVVALFTEMYGFPLTIYLPTNWPGRAYPIAEPFGHVNGHLLAVIAGGSAEVVFMVDIVISLGFLAALLVRGNALLVRWPSLSSWLMAPALIVTYIRLARREERDVSERFRERYLAYRARTPAFAPSWGSLRQRPVAAPEMRT